jgi:lysophospholipase L1-like esterase
MTEMPDQNKAAGIGHRLVKLYQLIAVLLLNTLVLLIVIELGAGFILRTSSPEEAPLVEQVETFKQKQLSLSYYQAQDWSRAYWDEHMAVADHWDYQPYIEWRTRPAQGELINVDENGIRYTPGSECGPDTYRIFMFGGSTMWGYGAPDWGTIPAYVQAGVSGDVCVVNDADVAFNATQNLITLIGELQRGNVPDMVIFYDGANEVTTAYTSGQPGAHFYLDQFEAAIQGNRLFDEQQDDALRNLLAQTNVARLMRRTSSDGGARQEGKGPVFPPYSDEFVNAIADVYLTDVTIAAQLAEAYDFDFLAFWQPLLVLNDEQVTDEEQRFLWEMPGGLPDLFKAVYPRIQAAEDILDLTHVLNDHEGSVWIDFNHLSPLGNEAVAQEMLKVIEPYLTNEL